MEECRGQSEHLCKQAASCIVQREQMDAAVLNGQPIDQFNYVRIGNLLTRTLRELRKLSTKPAKSSNDATKHKSRGDALLTCSNHYPCSHSGRSWTKY